MTLDRAALWEQPPAGVPAPLLDPALPPSPAPASLANPRCYRLIFSLDIIDAGYYLDITYPEDGVL